MKTTNYIGGGVVPVPGNPVLMDGEPAKEAKEKAEDTTETSRAFPTNLLIAALLLTAGTIAWPSYNHFSGTPVSFRTSAVVGFGLLISSLVTWFVTTRAMLAYHRDTLKDAEAAVRLKQIRKERDLMRLIIDHLPDCIYAKDCEGRFVLNNIAHAKDLGATTPAEMVGKSDFDFFPKELATQFFADEKKIIDTGEGINNQEQFRDVHYLDTPQKRWSYTSKVLWRDKHGKVIGTAGITRDIHESKMAQEALAKSEEKLRQFTLQLERSNRELQDFAYVASHDLQEPLRKIVVFGERLKEKCSEALSTDGKDYLERMQKAAGRMQVLITDLLSFSRVTTKAQPFSQLNLAEVVRDVVSDLEGRIEMVKGRVELGTLPVVEAEPLQMRQILQNLIGNALKFRRPEEPPVVKVEGRIFKGHRPGSAPDAPDEALCELSVSDNGIGFDEKYLDRIFNVFQRLHTRNEYEGTGMGLAIARKIALYHGGDLTAKSKPGQGATFIMTVPVVHPKQEQHHHE